GTVSTIGTNSFTVTRGGGKSITVDVSSSTTFSEHGGSSVSCGNLAVGDRVNVGGTLSSTEGVVNGNHVSILPFPHVDFTGTITAIGTNSFTVARGAANSVTVDVSSSTTYSEHGITGVSFANLAVGERVAIG